MKYVYFGNHKSPLCAITDEQMDDVKKIKGLYEKRGNELFFPIALTASSIAEHKFLADRLEDVKPSAVKNAFWADWCKYLVIVSGKEKDGECVNPNIVVINEEKMDFRLRLLDRFFKQSVQRTKDSGRFIAFNLVGDESLETTELMTKSPLVIKDGAIVTEDMTSYDFKKVINNMELALAAIANAEFYVNATVEDLADLERRLREYADMAEQHEFLSILRAENLIKKATVSEGSPSAQYLRNKAMYETLKNVFHDPNASKYLARKDN